MASAVVVVPLVLQHIGIGEQAALLVRFGRRPFLVFLLLFALAVLYRFGPSRRGAPVAMVERRGRCRCDPMDGGIVSVLLVPRELWRLQCHVGSLGAVIGLMMWLWMSAIIILAGTELNSEIEHQAVVAQKDHAVEGAPKATLGY